jgi:hypothetical protein
MKSLAAVLLLAAPAFADPLDAAPGEPAVHHETGFVGGGVSVGGGHLMHAAWQVEGALAVPDSAVYVRAAAQRGGAFDFEGTGEFWRATGGFEVRDGAFVAGVDLGYQHETWASGDPGDIPEVHEGLVVGPHAGIDAGGEHVRFRVMVEYDAYHHASNVGMTSWDRAGGVSVGLAYRL